MESSVKKWKDLKLKEESLSIIIKDVGSLQQSNALIDVINYI